MNWFFSSILPIFFILTIGMYGLFYSRRKVLFLSIVAIITTMYLHTMSTSIKEQTAVTVKEIYLKLSKTDGLDTRTKRHLRKRVKRFYVHLKNSQWHQFRKIWYFNYASNQIMRFLEDREINERELDFCYHTLKKIDLIATP